MTAGPEKKTKDAIRALLKEIGAWYYMPVPVGYGRSTVDFIGIYKGQGFVIEAKRPDGKGVVTPAQEREIVNVGNAGGLACVEDTLECINVRKMLGLVPETKKAEWVPTGRQLDGMEYHAFKPMHNYHYECALCGHSAGHLIHYSSGSQRL